MRRNSEKVAVGQDSRSMTESIFVETIEGEVRRAMLAVMRREVDLLCGDAYHPLLGQGPRRAGSERGRYYWEGRAHEVIRPRVRQGGREVKLTSYQVARDRTRETPDLIRMIEGGMTLQGIERLDRAGFSKAVAQRAWKEESAKAVERLRSVDLSQRSYFSLMVDGVFLTREMVVVVAVGFCTDGSKQVLDFVVGSTESYDVCRDLMKRLVRRGFGSVCPSLLVIIDGGDGLRKSIVEAFPKAKIQRCWVHKERNLYGYLRWNDRGECRRLVERIRKAEGKQAGEEAFEELARFLKGRNQAALQSLQEGGEDLLTFHRLNVPATLNRTFLSTNVIENVMLNFRRHTGRVKRWRPQSDQAERWTATALLIAQRGFRKIPHSDQIPRLLQALGWLPAAAAPDDAPGEANPSGSSTPSTPSGAGTKKS